MEPSVLNRSQKFAGVRARTLLLFCALFFVVISSALAQEQESSIANMEPVVVIGTVESTPTGKTVLDTDQLSAIPNRNGSINEALTVVPGVQYSDTSTNSFTAGEIRPASISLNGASVYQNNFQIDGIGNNSLLDPLEDDTTSGTVVPGHPQQLFLNPRLIQNVTVYDNNIPAEYGGFNGGVIDAETLRPNPDDLDGSTYFRTTRDEWTTFHLDEADRANFENSSKASEFQPNFEKYDFGLILNLPTGDDSAIIASYQQLYSEITVRHFDAVDTQYRINENYFFKYGHEIDSQTFFSLAVTHAPYEGAYTRFETLNSDFTIQGGGSSIVADFEQSGRFGDWSVTSAYLYSENSRNAPKDLFRWDSSTPSKDWGQVVGSDSYEGMLGDLETSQETVQFKFDYTSVKSEIISLPNQLKAGVDFSLINGQYDRPETSYFYSSDFVQLSPPASSFTCLPGDLACVENEQYLRRREEFQATAIDVDLNTFDLFAEDTIWMNRLRLRLGVRYSYDDLMQNNNVAPRLAVDYDVIGNGQTVLLAGWNRYYDQTLLTYALREAFSPTPIRVDRPDQTISFDFDPDPSTAPNLTIRPGNQEYHFSKLKSPYVDETVAGLKQFICGGVLDLRYIYRKYEDQFARERERISGVSHYELNNNGSRRYQSVRASWNRAWLAQALEVNATWQETESTNEDYGVTFDDDDLTEKVLYNGEFMYKHELPREDFNRNWVANLHYTAKISSNFNFINFTKYRSGYSDLDITSGSPKFINDPIEGLIFIYEKIKRPSSMIFDWILEWTPPISAQRNFMISIEAYNVFDKKVSVGEEDDEYELGRQFWLGAEYRF